MRALSRTPARPLLKWAGGKRQLLETLSLHYPSRFRRYVEPFLGSGAVFFDLHARGLLDGRRAWLADANPDLVGCYRMVRDDAERVITALRRLEAAHRQQGERFYYEVRDRRFNPARAILHKLEYEVAARGYTPQLAAMLIFLNRTGFNGLFRLNRDGAFNVPAGRYSEPRICDAARVRDVAAAFAAPGVSMTCASFEEVLSGAGSGDFVYCDPPYAPLSRTASFAHYTSGGFSVFDQRRLQQALIDACRRGAHVVLSNSSAPDVVALYSSTAARNAGLTLTFVAARRAINSRATARGPVHEVVVTNVRPTARDIAGPRKLQMAKAAARPTRVRSA